MKTRMPMVVMCLGAVLSLATVPGHAAVESTKKQTSVLSVFVPLAAGGAGEIGGP